MSELNNNDVTNVLIQDILKEKRSDRRWKNIRFIAWFLLILYLVLAASGAFRPFSRDEFGGEKKYAALIRLNGMIAPSSDFSAETMIPVLEEAFKDKKAAGVILDINSPGGTPVQAAIIHDAILEFKNKYHKKVIVVGEDLLTSGAYYVAVAADEIYVNPNSLTGSIGVIMKGFGFVDLMKKIGVERRVYTIGADKDRLDPFLPQSPEDLKKIQSVMSEVHQNFVKAVEEGRKGKLKGDLSILFTGDFWSGQTAAQLGLVDGTGDLLSVSDKFFGTHRFKEFGASSGLFRRLGGQLNSAFDTMFYYA
jgi:protease IV